VAAIAVLRLIPVVRMGTTVGTGVIGIRLRDFVLGSAVAALIWTGLPLILGYTFRSRLETLESYYAHTVSALPVLLGVTSLVLVAAVLIKSPATRLRLRSTLSPIFPPFLVANPLPLAEIPQETPPVVH
jgi:membrane protein DedA with SNARE-associated domain